MFRGIRARVCIVAAATVVGVLVVTAVALLAAQRRVLLESLDEQVAANAVELARLAERGPSAILEPRGDDDSVAQIATLDGDVIASTENFARHPALPPPPDDDRSDVRSARLLPDESTYRIVSIRTDGHVVHAASPTEDIDESIAALRGGLLVAVPIVAAVLAALTWVLVGRTLRPVEAIRHEVDNITGANLDRRVPVPDSHDEIHDLAVTMNSMLDRLERSAASQHRFVADASHELRTPLTRMRAELEVDRAHPETADLLATHDSVLEEARRMQRLVEDLLILARHDDDRAANDGLRMGPIDLDDVVLEEVRQARQNNGPTIELRVAPVEVRGDSGQLARLVRNLLDNALRHALSAVTVELTLDNGLAVLSVADDGPGIDPAHVETVFERFSRIDAARSQLDGGTGLGLAIAKAIVERHTGTISIDPDHRPGARFVVELPAPSAGSSARNEPTQPPRSA